LSVSHPRSPTWGFIGAGEITAAIVEGLHADDASPPAVFLSPRGQKIGRELAGRFPNVQVCGSNQEVLENATSIVVAVRPPLARTVLEGLSFRPRHVVMSAMAGVRLERLEDWAPRAGHIVRVIPLPQAARRQSITVMYPDNAVARDLFGRVGSVLVPSEEATVDAFSAATATLAALLDHITTIARWLTDHGVDHQAATTYTAHIIGQLGHSASHGADSLTTLAEKYKTPGGINEQFMTDLRREGVPEIVRSALDRVLARLRGHV
jgi:pyrroline-5-carboxylate reductase